MGHEFEVCAFASTEESDEVKTYGWLLEYEGDNFIHAIDAMQKLKDKGVKCVRLLWR